MHGTWAKELHLKETKRITGTYSNVTDLKPKMIKTLKIIDQMLLSRGTAQTQLVP